MRQISFFLTFSIISFLAWGQGRSKVLDPMQKAGRLTLEGKYAEAIETYQGLLQKDSTRTEVWFKMAQVLDRNNQPREAQAAYEKVISLPHAPQNYAWAYQKLGDLASDRQAFAVAKTYYQQAWEATAEQNPNRPALQRKIASMEMRLEAPKAILPITPLPAPLNQYEKQYFPALTADGNTLFFTARQDAQDENLYMAVRPHPQASWSAPQALPAPIQTTGNEGTCTVSGDGKRLIFTACDREDGRGSCDLYLTEFTETGWSEPVNLGPEINSPQWDSQPSLSVDGKLLYFVSERSGGFGKKDIWWSKQLANGTWSRAQNAGIRINTAFDELSPFLHPNTQVLLFSSNGWPGLGGYDLFVHSFTKPNERPIHLTELNSPRDEISVAIDHQVAHIFFSRSQGDSIQLVQMPVPQIISEKIAPTRTFRGQLISLKTKRPISGTVELFNLQTTERSVQLATDREGRFVIPLPSRGHYALFLSAPSHINRSLALDTLINATGETVVIGIEPVEANQIFVLDHLFFSTGQFTLEDASRIRLGKVVQLLQDNPKLFVTIQGHTDDIGDAAQNQILSEKRAQSVVNYLISAGIAQSRLEAKGWGESLPRVANTSEANRQLNRRIEMKIR